MFPVLLEIGGWKIQSYGFFIALGYLGALAVTRRVARGAGFPPSVFSDICFLALITGILGARALFLLVNLDHFQSHPSSIWNFWSGGLVFYGGFLSAFAFILLFLRWKKFPVPAGLDVLAPGLAFGHAIGRIGCLAAGCCHGGRCDLPWGISLDSDLVSPALRGIPLHPTQLYESIGLFALGVFLLRLNGRKHKPGTVSVSYVLGYGLLRFLVEFFRGDSARGFLPGTGISTSQAIALALVLFGLLAVFFLRRGSGRGLGSDH